MRVWFMEEREEFRPVVGWPAYRVSNLGRVQSCWKYAGGGRYWELSDEWHDLTPTPNVRWGYISVLLRNGGRCRRRTVHKIVMEAFVGPCPPGMEVCHNDNDRRNARLSNLRYDTRKANHADKHRHGTARIGSKHSQAKLKEADIAEILRLRAEGATQTSVAKRFGVCRPLISMIESGKSWSHVPRPQPTP